MVGVGILECCIPTPNGLCPRQRTFPAIESSYPAPSDQYLPGATSSSKGRTNEKNAFNADCINFHALVVCACFSQDLRTTKAPARQLLAHSFGVRWRWPQTWTKFLAEASR